MENLTRTLWMFLTSAVSVAALRTLFFIDELILKEKREEKSR